MKNKYYEFGMFIAKLIDSLLSIFLWVFGMWCLFVIRDYKVGLLFLIAHCIYQIPPLLLKISERK